MNEKCCLNCGNWDTYGVPPRCGLIIKQNNPSDFKNKKYQIENRNEAFWDQWKISAFPVYF